MVAYRVGDVFPCRLHGYKGAVGDVHHSLATCHSLRYGYDWDADSKGTKKQKIV